MKIGTFIVWIWEACRMDSQDESVHKTHDWAAYGIPPPPNLHPVSVSPNNNNILVLRNNNNIPVLPNNNSNSSNINLSVLNRISQGPWAWRRTLLSFERRMDFLIATKWRPSRFEKCFSKGKSLVRLFEWPSFSITRMWTSLLQVCSSIFLFLGRKLQLIAWDFWADVEYVFPLAKYATVCDFSAEIHGQKLSARIVDDSHTSNYDHLLSPLQWSFLEDANQNIFKVWFLHFFFHLHFLKKCKNRFFWITFFLGSSRDCSSWRVSYDQHQLCWGVAFARKRVDIQCVMFAVSSYFHGFLWAGPVGFSDEHVQGQNVVERHHAYPHRGRAIVVSHPQAVHSKQHQPCHHLRWGRHFRNRFWHVYPPFLSTFAPTLLGDRPRQTSCCLCFATRFCWCQPFCW